LQRTRVLLPLQGSSTPAQSTAAVACHFFSPKLRRIIANPALFTRITIIVHRYILSSCIYRLYASHHIQDLCRCIIYLIYINIYIIIRPHKRTLCTIGKLPWEKFQWFCIYSFFYEYIFYLSVYHTLYIF